MVADNTYTGRVVTFRGLIETGHNIDRFVIDQRLVSRPDHDIGWLLRCLEPGSVVYDVGASIGMCSIPMALENMLVHASEGYPDNHARAVRSCAPYAAVSVRLAAASDCGESVCTKFNDCTDLPASPGLITCVTLDECVAKRGLEPPDFEKNGIGEMRALALHGMPSLLETTRPVRQIGYHVGLDVRHDEYPVSAADGGFDVASFSRLGYMVHDQRSREVPGFRSWGDYRCIPEERVISPARDAPPVIEADCR